MSLASIVAPEAPECMTRLRRKKIRHDDMIDRTQDIITITLTGEYDLATGPALASVLQPAEAARMAVIDLTKTTSLDSTSLGLFLRLRSQMFLQSGRADVRLCGANTQISRILLICGFDTMFSLYPTVQEALDSPAHDARAVQYDGRFSERYVV